MTLRQVSRSADAARSGFLARPRPRAARTGLAAAVVVAVVAGLNGAGLARAAQTFVVDSPLDAVDARVGDGLCRTSAGRCTLRAALQEANSRSDADTILVPAGTYALSIRGRGSNDVSSGDLDITRPVSILGAGAGSTIVDAGQPPAGSPPEIRGLDRLFEIHASGGNVTIAGVTIQDGYSAGTGGGIQHVSPGILRLADATVRGSYAGKYGGGVNNAGAGRIELVGSVLSGNGAVEGGAAVNNAAAGTVALAGSAVRDNPGVYPPLAGAVHNQALNNAVGTISIVDSTVSGNAAVRDGAGVSNEGDGRILVASSQLSGNSTAASGGGIHNISGSVSVTDSVISDNHAGADAGTGNGGGVYNVGQRTSAGVPAGVEIARTTISNNSASGDGGGLAGGLEADLVLSDSIVSHNSAGSAGGGVSSQTKASMAIARVELSDNNAASRGGGVYTHGDGAVTIEDAQFARNSAGVDGGGGLYTDGSGTVSVVDSTFSDNGAVGHGGGVAIHSSGDVMVADSEIVGNRSHAGGGGVLNSGMRVDFRGVTVAGNAATDDGGGIGDGGGIENESSAEFVVADSTIVDNESVNGGGFANAADGALRISGSTIDGNVAGQVGGGFLNRNDAPTSIENSTLSHNHAELGGGFANRSDAGTEIVNSTVSGNVATSSGGGFYGDADADLRLVHVTISANSAPTGSGVGLASQSPNVPVIASAGVILRNTIVAGNVGSADCDGALGTEGGNLESADSCYLRDPSDRRNAGDPGLEALSANGGPTATHALAPASPAVDGGVAPCPAKDQRGLVRPEGNPCDIGAFELAGIAPPPDDPAQCGAPVTASADGDSWIEQSSPFANKGDDSVLKVRSKSPEDSVRALVRFALPDAIPVGCEVASATLQLYAASATPGRTLEAVQVAGAWAESEVAWSEQPATVDAAVTAASGGGYVDWNVTEAVRAMYAGEPNHGFLIRDAAEDDSGAEQEFHSREKGENAPRLVVVFAPAGG